MSFDSKHEQSELLRLAVDLCPSGIIVVESSGNILLVNREIERMFGYTRAELIGRPIETLVPDRFRPAHPGHRHAYVAKPETRPMGAGRELFGVRKDGTQVPVEIGLNPVGTDAGLLVMASVVDISARRRDEDRFQAAVESAPSGMVMVDTAGLIVLVNRETERLFGYPRGELIGKKVDMLVPERYRGLHPGHRAAFFTDPQTRPMGRGRELYGLRRDGSEIPVEIGLNPIRAEDGLYVLSSIVDVSERRKAERALRESEERFRLLVSRIQDYAIIMLDPEGRVASWNEGAQRISGYTDEEIIGQSFSVFFPAEDVEAGKPAQELEAATRDGRYESETWRIRKDGSRFIASVYITPLLSDDGQLRGFARLTRDVTARRMLEDQLRQSQKMEAIGTLAGGIAHDFNNILLAIMGFCELAESQLRDRPEVAADLREVQKAADRGRRLVQRILTFSRQREAAYTPIRLDRPVRESLQLLRASLPTTIEMRDDLDPSTPTVLADETQIHQVVMNLATNAAHAMGSDGGIMEVSLAPCVVDEDFVRAHTELRPGLHARISVSDSGQGMTPEMMRRIFEPFFTTKPAGEGSGLGLSVVHGLVSAMNGAIDVQSVLGSGTTIRIYLPAAESMAAREEKPVSPVPPGKKHILFVEDEEMLANLGRRQLGALGYHVTGYTSSIQALEDFRSRPTAFDLVITDNTMPRMTGLALAEEILRIRPDCKILMVSGIGEAMDPNSIVARGIRKLLPKPHSTDELAAAVREVLEG